MLHNIFGVVHQINTVNADKKIVKKYVKPPVFASTRIYCCEFGEYNSFRRQIKTSEYLKSDSELNEAFNGTLAEFLRGE